MASLCPFARAAEEALSCTGAVMGPLYYKAGVASHSPYAVAEETHHCTAARVGAAGVAAYVRNMPHHERGVRNTAGTL